MIGGLFAAVIRHTFPRNTGGLPLGRPVCPNVLDGIQRRGLSPVGGEIVEADTGWVIEGHREAAAIFEASIPLVICEIVADISASWISIS